MSGGRHTAPCECEGGGGGGGEGGKNTADEQERGMSWAACSSLVQSEVECRRHQHKVVQDDQSGAVGVVSFLRATGHHLHAAYQREAMKHEAILTLRPNAVMMD